VAGSWLAALIIFADMTTGSDVASSAVVTRASDAVIVPAPMIWAAAATFAVVAGGSVILIVVGAYALIVQRRLGESVKAAYADEGEGSLDDPIHVRRFRYIRRHFLLGRAPDFVSGTVGVFTVLVVIILIAGMLGYAANASAISNKQFAYLYQVGSAETLAIGALSILMARLAFSDPEDRKKIGVLWDVGTFWPRATHPLAPPCYGERAVPDLIERIEYYRGVDGTDKGVPPDGNPVVLSCHSQGSIIGAAAILQLRFRDSANVLFLTYGSPLRRLYARYFPDYFGARTLCRVGALLSTTGGKEAPVTAVASARTTWRWRNLWRPTDPVGHPIFVDYAGYEDTAQFD
jgi:hypothetical protein